MTNLTLKRGLSLKNVLKWGRQHAGASDQELRLQIVTAIRSDGPAVLGFLPVRGVNPSVKLNVSIEVQLVGDIV
jgi:hypothetical protein